MTDTDFYEHPESIWDHLESWQKIAMTVILALFFSMYAMLPGLWFMQLWIPSGVH